MSLFRQRGFSLPELLVVIAIGVLMAAIALPNLAQRIRSYRTVTAAQQVRGDLQAARMRAFSENVRFRMVLTANGDAYVLERRNPVTLVYAPVTAYSLPTFTRFTGVVTSPVFLPSGLVNSPGAITVVNSQGEGRTITVSAVGSIRIP